MDDALSILMLHCPIMGCPTLCIRHIEIVRDIYQTYQPNVINSSPILLVLVVQGLVTYIYSCYGSLYHRLLSYTLIHNKDVALKGFLCGCRSLRLNHVTLVFTVFLFYAFLFCNPFQHTQHGITHHIANNIYLTEINSIKINK